MNKLCNSISRKGENNTMKPFDGPPTNCSELGQLGYTLIGYYLVNGSHGSRQIEVILCLFTLPPSYNKSTLFQEITVFIGEIKI